MSAVPETGDTESETRLETYTKLGEKLGTGALAQVAAIMDHNHEQTQRILDEGAEYNRTEAAAVARSYLDLLDCLEELNEKLDSLRLNFLLSAQTNPAKRAERLVGLALADKIR